MPRRSLWGQECPMITETGWMPDASFLLPGSGILCIWYLAMYIYTVGGGASRVGLFFSQLLVILSLGILRFNMSSPFVGKWKLTTQENFDEYLKAIGNLCV